MSALLTPARCRKSPAPRRVRIDAPTRKSEVYPESLYLRRWAARQVAGYQNLLLTVAAAAKAAGND